MGAGTLEAAVGAAGAGGWARAGVAEAAGFAVVEAERLDPTPTLRLRKPPPPLLLLRLPPLRPERCVDDNKNKSMANEMSPIWVRKMALKYCE